MREKVNPVVPWRTIIREAAFCEMARASQSISMELPAMPGCRRLDLRNALFAVSLVSISLLAQETRAAFTESSATILGFVNYDSRSASLADIDNDGDLDLMFQGGSGARQLFRNNLIGSGSLTYTNITSDIPTSTLGPSWSAAWGDYDSDGLVDVFIGQSNIGASGDVLHNDGATGFSNTSVATGLNDPGFHQNVAWCDIDNDNDLDLIIGM